MSVTKSSSSFTPNRLGETSSTSSLENKRLRRRVGEIFVIDGESNYSLVCKFCGRAFSFFYEFKLHIEEPCKDRNRFDALVSSDVKLTSADDQYDIDIMNKNMLPMEKALKLIRFKNPNEVRPLIEGSDYTKIAGKIKCMRCDKNVKCKRELRNHLTVIHGDKRKKNYKCPLCPRQFLLVEYVQRHLSNAHNVRYTIEMIRMAQPIEEQDNSQWQSKVMIDSLQEQIKLMTKQKTELENLLASGQKYSRIEIDKILNDDNSNSPASGSDNGMDDTDCTNNLNEDESDENAKANTTNEQLLNGDEIKTEVDLD